MPQHQIGLLERTLDENPNNSANLPIDKKKLGSFQYNMAMLATLD